MTVQAQDILRAIEQLPESDKQEIVVELLKRSHTVAAEALSDDELVCAAEAIFLALDHDEAGDA